MSCGGREGGVLMEGTKSCMNAVCGASLAGDGWRKGWALRSGGFAVLCNTCGLAYEQQFFCDAFHAKETGWRECSSCRKVKTQENAGSFSLS